MDKNIIEAADRRDLEALKYIFVDALDVDPTFVNYEEEYAYCKSIPGLLEKHITLTPFETDQSKWDENYWYSLKRDLQDNFSDRRMTHMREVAKVYLAEKVQRLLKERKERQEKVEQDVVITVKPDVNKNPKERISVSKAEEEQRKVDEAKKELEKHNQQVEAEQRRKEQERVQVPLDEPTGKTRNELKKVLGIVLTVVIIAVIIVTLLLK